jgi:class 3 adenylate cyclase/tetratricopeptide (TPR) repeat protein
LAQSAQILLVSRRDPQDPVRRILKGAGYSVVSIDSPSAAVRTAERSRPALIVLEPGAVPPTVAESLVAFAGASQTPLVRDWSGPEAFLAEVERALGKPETAGREDSQIVVGPLCVDLAGHEARVGACALDLTAREFELLCHLARHPGWVYSRQELLEQVWGYEFGDPRVVTVHMANLRKKLDAACPGCELIETVRNVGYKLVAPAAAPPTSAAQTRPTSSDSLAPVSTPAAAPVATKRPAAERRLVTVLFTHIGGLSRLAETVDFDSLRELADHLFDLLVPCVTRYDGQVERRSPDTFVALFGAPVAHENDSEMAVRAAFDMHEAAAAFEREKHDQGLSLHAGICAGMVVGGASGSDGADYSVVGEPVDSASFLADVAGPGEVLMDSEALRVTAPMVTAEPAGTMRTRGRAEELAYHRVTSVAANQSRRGSDRSIESELVGREEQVGLFRACLDRLEDGLGSVVFVTGEAGVGKSRLTAEIRRSANARNIKWLEARTLSYGRNISYLPVREMVQADCGIGPDDALPERETKLGRRVEMLFADKAGEILPALADLLGVAGGRLSEGEPLRPEEESFRRALVESVIRYVRRVSTEQPLVLAFEDVHWLDRSSVALIASLLTLSAECPVVVCLVGRTGADSPTLELRDEARRHDSVRCVDVDLARLSHKQTQQLVRNLLRGSRIEPPVMRTIASRSEGNPLFVEEIIRHLIDAGRLRRSEGGSWAVTKAGDFTIPTTIHGVIAARIDRLPEETRQDALKASVIGRSFYRRLLRFLSTSEDDVFESNLRSLQDHQLIFVKRQVPELEYAFKHALVQEAAYGTLLLKQRKQLHHSVAEGIEELYRDRMGELYGILAYHYTKAEDWPKAQTFLLKAGDQAVGVAAAGEAVVYYQEAMAVLLRAFDETADSPGMDEQIRWFVAATEPFWLARCLGDLLDSAQVFYERVSHSCGPVDPRTSAAAAILAGCFFQREAFDTCESLVRKTVDALEAAGREDDPSITRMLLLLGLVCTNTDRFIEGEAIFTRALTLEQNRKPPNEGVLQDCYIFLSTSHSFTGRHQDMRRLIEEAMSRFDLKGTQRGWMLMINLCWVNTADGFWDEAAAIGRECVEGIRSPYLRAVALRHLAEVRFLQGAYLEAEEHLKSALAVVEESEEPRRRFEELADLGETQLRAGKVDKAEETILKLLALMEATAPDCYEAPAVWTLAGVKMARGELAEADTLLERSAAVVQEKYSPRHPFCVEFRFRTALLRLLQGRTPEAEQDYEEAVVLMADIGGEGHPRIVQMRVEWEKSRHS